MRACVCVYVRACVRAGEFVRVCLYMCVCACVRACVRCVCVCFPAHTKSATSLIAECVDLTVVTAEAVLANGRF